MRRVLFPFLMATFGLSSVNAEVAEIFEADHVVSTDPIRGVVKSKNEAVISADLRARVIETPKRTGEVFKKGDLLMRFECTAEKAEVDAATATYRASKARHESNVEMKAYDAIGQFDLKLSKAEMDHASAQARAMKARTKNCDIHAPYDGKVAEISINVFETPSTDQPLIKIVGFDELELHLIVPSNWLTWIKPETTFDFIIDETGQRIPASVLRIGAEVDAVSRTVPIIARFTVPSNGVLPGMSGSAYFKSPIG